MSQLAQYLIKLSISISVIWLFYTLVLRRLTFYTWNRWYLLGYSILAFFIPFINIAPLLQQSSLSETEMIRVIPVIDSYTIIPSTLPDEAAPLHQITYQDILFWCFLAGVYILLVRMLVQYISYRRLRRSAKIWVTGDIKVYQVDKHIVPFSFGRAIFVNRHQYREDELEKIIRHEFVHVRQQHTMDILWGEMLCILNWYNPFAWLIRKSMRRNLEFIADNQVLQNGIDKKQYQYLLLKVIGGRAYSITHPFNFSALKKRIAMMNKIPSSRVQLVKFLFLLPLITVLLLAFRSLPVLNDQTNKNRITQPDMPATGTIINNTEVGGNGNVRQENDITYKQLFDKTGAGRFGTAVIDTTGPFVIDASLNGPYNPYYHITGISVRDTVPLIVVDGVIKDYRYLHEISPDDIESIQILKNEKAFDAYGEKGKAGVIKITTKKDKGIRISADKAYGKKDSVSMQGNVKISLSDLAKIHALFVVDGVEMSQAEFEAMNMDPYKIVTVDILKGTSATDKYGAKGLNGVIEITTKEHNNEAFSGSIKVIERDTIDIEGISKISFTDVPGKNPLFVVNNIEFSLAEYKKMQIDPADIASISILKGDAALKAYGEKGRDGVIIVTTRGHSNEPVTGNGPLPGFDPKNALYVIDGIEFSQAEIKVLGLDPTRIEHLDIYKGKEAIDRYGVKGRNGVMVITLKKTTQTGRDTTTTHPQHFSPSGAQIQRLQQNAGERGILYVGVDNPLPKDLFDNPRNTEVQMDNGYVYSKEDGLFYAKPMKPGKAIMKVFLKTNKGEQVLIHTREYTVQYLPPPSTLLNDRS